MAGSMDSLFNIAAENVKLRGAPLSDRMRPRTLAEYVGQQAVLGPGKILRRLIEAESVRRKAQELGVAENNVPKELRGPLPSIILWGPPSTGKTTLAILIAQAADAHFSKLSAVQSGVKDAREIIEAAQQRLSYEQRRTVLFVDEIHRFNKSQQDAFLPAIESGTISLLGATTENPSFELNGALISRSRVFVLQHLSGEEIAQLLDRAMSDSVRGLGGLNLTLEPAAREALSTLSGGDARSALNGLELAAHAARDVAAPHIITADLAKEALQRHTILYDQSGEEHYNLISALHKSIRHSDPDAALYYLMRMIEGGEDPIFLARRLVRIASEDIGLADPQAVVQALAAKQASEFIGYPECDTALAQAAIYLALAPKSNAIYMAVKAAREEVKKSGPLPTPLHYRNAPTQLMKDQGYHAGYQYDHDWPERISPQEALPDKLVGTKFYEPGQFGFEKDLKKRMEWFVQARERAKQQRPPS